MVFRALSVFRPLCVREDLAFSAVQRCQIYHFASSISVFYTFLSMAWLAIEHQMAFSLLGGRPCTLMGRVLTRSVAGRTNDVKTVRFAFLSLAVGF